jgi:hypothetical protein
MHPASREQDLAAVRAFHTEHGRLPRWREWELATESRPCAKTIERRWGWRKLLAEAVGVKPTEVEVSWVLVLDDRADLMLRCSARSGRGRAMADRGGVGGGSSAPVAAYIRTALRELAGGVSGGGGEADVSGSRPGYGRPRSAASWPEME